MNDLRKKLRAQPLVSCPSSIFIYNKLQQLMMNEDQYGWMDEGDMHVEMEMEPEGEVCRSSIYCLSIQHQLKDRYESRLFCIQNHQYNKERGTVAGKKCQHNNVRCLSNFQFFQSMNQKKCTKPKAQQNLKDFEKGLTFVVVYLADLLSGRSTNNPLSINC